MSGDEEPIPATARQTEEEAWQLRSVQMIRQHQASAKLPIERLHEMEMAHSKKMVRLAPGEWLPVRHVALRIAAAIQPDRRSAKGVELIQKKLVAIGTHDEPWCPKDLTSKDLEQLEAVFERLPQIHGKMTENDKQTFLMKYMALPLTERPDWLPSIPTAYDLYREVGAMHELANEHLNSLSQAIRAGALLAVNKHHAQVSDLGFDTLVARDEVAQHLRKLGFEVVEEKPTDPLTAPSEDPSEDPSDEPPRLSWRPVGLSQASAMES